MEELREHTDEVLYENYRTEKLLAQGVEQISIGNMLVGSRGDQEREGNEARLQKMAQEMKQVFQVKVQEKEQKLKQSEEEVRHHKIIIIHTQVNSYRI
jgi:septin 7